MHDFKNAHNRNDSEVVEGLEQSSSMQEYIWIDTSRHWEVTKGCEVGVLL